MEHLGPACGSVIGTLRNSLALSEKVKYRFAT